MSLRARLLILTVALVFVGLAVAGVATFRLQRSFLLDRVDDQLVFAREPAARLLSLGPGGLGPPGERNERLFIPGGSYAALLDENGRLVDASFLVHGGFAADPSPPALPAGLPGSSVRPGGLSAFNAPALDDAGPRYRVLATAVRGGGTLVVAIPLTEVRASLARLLRVEVTVGAIVLLVVAGLALWLVRVGLRPLEGIGATAGAIAAGDLSRRVEPADERTEIGRLGLSLNAMLAQIERAFEERRQSEERLRQFVADASHELRTPLTSIRGYAELFRIGAKSRPVDLETSMARIESEAARMGVLVDDLLLLARLDQGRPLERQPVDLSAVAAEAVDSALVVEPARVISLDATEPVSVLGDRGRLRQVIDNLLDNVRTHTPDGTPAAVSVQLDDGQAVLRVADEGPGVPAEKAAHIFDRFYRGDAARSRGGAGLGLSIVSAIVEAHGGTVGVGSPNSSGATFEVRLPATTSAG